MAMLIVNLLDCRTSPVSRSQVFKILPRSGMMAGSRGLAPAWRSAADLFTRNSRCAPDLGSRSRRVCPAMRGRRRTRLRAIFWLS